MYRRDGLRLIRKGAAAFADELSAASDSGKGSQQLFLVANIV